MKKLFFSLLALIATLSVNAQGWVGEAVQAGTDYYLYNVESGYFLTAGNDWGTQATLDTPGFIISPKESGTGFILNTHKNGTKGSVNFSAKKNNKDVSLGANGYMDNDANSIWVLTNVGTNENPVYTLATDGKYLYYDGASSVVKVDASADLNSNKSKWLFITQGQIDNHASKATMESPVDMTYLIQDANFTPAPTNKRARIYTWPGSLAYNFDCAEKFRAAFDAYQEIDVPNGRYDLEIQGFARLDGGSSVVASLYANSESVALKNITADARAEKMNMNEQGTEGAWYPNNMETAHAYFNEGRYWNKVTVIVTTGKLRVGVKTTVNNEWVLFDNMKLTYYGVDLTALNDVLTEKLTTARAITGMMNVDVAQALADAISAAENVAQTEAALTEAAGNLETAINNANTSVAYYANITAKYNTLDAAGKDMFATTETGAKYIAKTLVDENTDADLRTAAKAQTSDNADMTLAIVNPSFENDFSGWTNNQMAVQTNNSFTMKDGGKYVEFWQPNGEKGLKQTITGLPGGTYRLTLSALARGVKSAEVYAGVNRTPITVEDATNDYSVDFVMDAGDVEIGFKGTGTGAGSSWLAIDNFRLTYVKSTIDFEELVPVEEKMNAEVAAAQTAAINAFNENKTIANYNAAIAAIEAARESADHYAAAAIALAAQKDLIDGTNVYAAGWTTGYVANYNTFKGKYDDNTMTNEDGVVNPTVATSWHASTAYNDLLTPWKLGESACNEFANALYINTWSTEGSTDGSNFTVPFFEYWVADGENLSNNTLTGTVTGLDNGLYSATAWVRVRATNGVGATDATGINLVVGDGTYTGSEGNGTVDATEGTQIGESQFTLAEVTAYGLVKDGTLNIAFNVADANISWLTFKNVMYAKVRDLTDAEAAIIPTAITLDKTEVTLTAAENTVTLVPTFTPGDATNTVAWETSDANVATVANGVVTGVAPGTATITVKSTLDENVKATCEVTVEYPETAYETTIEEVDAQNNAAINVSTLSSANIIKNGSFEYPNGLVNWNMANGAAMAAANFDVVTEGENHYIKSKTHAGSAGAGSIRTAWAIENGKTYVFSYKVKASAAGNSQYHVVSLTNTVGTETTKVSIDNTPITTDWTTVTYKFTNSGNLAYAQFNARWLGDKGAYTCFDDFYLAEVTETSQIGNVDYAKEQIPTTNVGTGAFQYSQDAIDAVNDLVKGTATVDNVEDAIEAMTTLNAPEDGDKFHVAITYNGYRYSGHALESNGTSGVTVPLADNTTKDYICNDWTFTPVAETKNGFTMSITTAEGTYYVCTGAQDNGSNDQQIRMTTDPAKALTIVVSPTKSQEGVYYLNNTRSSNASIGCQDDRNSNGGWYTTGSHNTHTITLATKATANLKVTDAQYGTFIAPFNAEKPENVTLYTCAATEGAVLTLVEAGAIVANTPYITFSASTVSETLQGWGLATTDSYTEGMLTGTYNRIHAPKDSYILQNNNDKVGFYLCDEAEKFVVAKNRCYLTTPAQAREAYFFEGDETAIGVIDALTSGKAEIYDLSGRRLNSLQKGINIINGKKVMVK